MTTAQIIFLGILLIIDFWFTAVKPAKEDQNVMHLLNFARFMIVWMIVFSITYTLNTVNKEKSAQKKVETPEYQLVTEPFYRKTK